MATVSRSPRTHTVTPLAGQTGPFLVGFRLFEDDALAVYEGTTPVSFSVVAHYSDGFSDTAQIVLTQPASGAPLRIEGDMKPARQDDYVPTDPNFVQNANIEMGRIWATLAELHRDTKRSVRTFKEVGPFTIAPGHLVIAAPDGGFQQGPEASDIAGAQGAAERAEAAAALLEGNLPAFQSLDALTSYSGNLQVGNAVETLTEGFAYRVVPEGGHQQTAAPAYLRVLNREGIYPIKAFGVKGDGAPGDNAAVQAAVNEAEVNRLNFDRGDYRISDILVPSAVDIAAVNGSGEVTANASGTQSTGVRFRYYGPGGAGSRLFTFKAPAVGQWVKGGGILGRPHLSGDNLCEILIDAQSMHGARFDVELSRATFAGMSLNGQNGVLSQFNRIDFKYVWGAQAATQDSHGLILNGNAPGTTGWVGCTQNFITSNGLVFGGDMVRMVGHCDNNKLDLHGATAGGGTGNSLAMYPGNAGKIAHVNKILYVCNDVYMGPDAYGNVCDFDTSEGARFWGAGAGLLMHQAQVDYITGKVFESPKAPLMREVFVPASEMHVTGAATADMVAGTPVISLPKGNIGGGAFTLHDPIWGAGQISSIDWLVRSVSGGNALIWGELTITKESQGLAIDDEISLATPMGSSSVVVRGHHPISRPVDAAGIVAVHLSRRPTSPLDTCPAAVELIGAIVRIDFNGPASLNAPNPPHRYQL